MGTINGEKPEWVLDCEKRFAGAIRECRAIRGNEFELFIEEASVRPVVEFLKNRPQGSFEHLADLTAYDEHPKSPRFFVVYELISMQLKLRARVIAVCSDSVNPAIDTVSDIWGGANWLEREVFDMFGIHFKGHPDLRRILLPESFLGNPLRKDFMVDYRQTFPHSNALETAFDPFGNTVVQGEEVE
jgi:NADH-quinone oxidoreductase subunit C